MSLNHLKGGAMSGTQVGTLNGVPLFKSLNHLKGGAMSGTFF